MLNKREREKKTKRNEKVPRGREFCLIRRRKKREATERKRKKRMEQESVK